MHASIHPIQSNPRRSRPHPRSRYAPSRPASTTAANARAAAVDIPRVFVRSFAPLARVHVSRVTHASHPFMHASIHASFRPFMHAMHPRETSRHARTLSLDPRTGVVLSDKRSSSHTLDYVRERTSNHPRVRHIRTLVRTSSIDETTETTVHLNPLIPRSSPPHARRLAISIEQSRVACVGGASTSRES